MSHSPIVRKLQPLARPVSRQVKAEGTWRARFIAMTTDPDLAVVVAFSVIGLLIALNVILRFPDLGAVIEQYNQF
jgi:hypothetical protein